MRKSILVVTLLFMVLFFGINGVCSAEVGVTGETIKIATICDQTGPAAHMGKFLIIGMDACVKRINDEGGIHGRKIKFLNETDNYAGAQTVAAARKLIDRDKIFCFVGNLGTPTNLALMPILLERKIPMVAPSTSAKALFVPPKRYIFGHYTTKFDNGRAGVDYIVNDLKMKDAKIAFLGADTPAAKGFLNGMKTQMKKYGMNMPVADEWHKMKSVDLSVQVHKLKSSGAEMLVINSFPTHIAYVIKKCHEIGWAPKTLIDPTSADQKLIDLSGKLSEGLVAERVYPLAETSQSWGSIEYRKALKKFYDKVPLSYPLAGYFSMKILELGLKDAGRDLTREKLVDALEAWKDKDTGFTPLTYNKTTRLGSTSTMFCIVKDGKFKKITGWRVPK